MKKFPVNFLHSHPSTQRKLGLDSGHIIVDKEDWIEAIDFIAKVTEEPEVKKPSVPVAYNCDSKPDVLE